MNHNGAKDPQAEERLGELILEYLDALQAGRPINRESFLRANPGFRGELEAFFAGHDRVERLVAPLREITGPCPDEKAQLSNSDCGQSWPSDAEPRPASATAPALGQLGEFRLLREVGRGGMGVVYEAEQISLQRRVALKVLPFAAAIDDRRLQRFKNEALAAAHLRHENIVPVYAVGADLGVHYYAMQFIEGQSLAVLIGQFRRLSGGRELPQDLSLPPGPAAEAAGTCFTSDANETPAGAQSNLTAASLSRDLSSGSRRYFIWLAGVGRQAANALEHAHQMGIVHRDIKPANLLLDPRGQLWVTDFGLAQVSGDAGLTMTGELLGTLRYASPEQARARRGLVDHRTDIYSLGATLYELLALRPIFEGRDRHELLRQIADEEPRSPRSTHPSVPVELETIVLKALAKEPSERYATAKELADDLQRFQEDRPILAKRPTPSERLRKWARRHPAVVIAGAALLLLLSAGSLVSTVLIHDEQREAEEAYQRERQRADEAEAQFRLARKSVDELFRVSERELADWPGTEALRKRLLTSVLSYYQEFVERCRDDPSAQAELLEARKRVEKILADLAVLRAAARLRLLSHPAVLDDLRLDDGQRAKVVELSARVEKQWKEALLDLGRVPPAERARRSLEQARANEAAVKAILNPEQLKRLYQIELQSDVPGAFREPEVASLLKLTNEQRERIRLIEEEALVGLLKTFWPELALADADKAAAPKNKQPNERILELLTDEQARHWREITGAPFKGPIQFPAPFGLVGPSPGSKGAAR
jgi:serine/threonine protein kinase